VLNRITKGCLQDFNLLCTIMLYTTFFEQKWFTLSVFSFRNRKPMWVGLYVIFFNHWCIVLVIAYLDPWPNVFPFKMHTLIVVKLIWYIRLGWIWIGIIILNAWNIISPICAPQLTILDRNEGMHYGMWKPYLHGI
jgi:hypothetical protein